MAMFQALFFTLVTALQARPEPAGPDSVNNITAASPQAYCGVITNQVGTPSGPVKGYQCPLEQGQWCAGGAKDPTYGAEGFDNFGQALWTLMDVRPCAWIV